jgi:N-acetylmuramoyl-L-alanine amidase
MRINVAVLVLAILLVRGPVYGKVGKLSKWTDVDLLTGLLIGETSGKNTKEMVLVAKTVKNRREDGNDTWKEVMLEPGQYTCFKDHNLQRIAKHRKNRSAEWKKARDVAVAVYLGIETDYGEEPTHFHLKSVRPEWRKALQRLGRVGDHIFYKSGGQ